MLFVDRLQKLAVFVHTCKNKRGPSSVHDLFESKHIPYEIRDSSKLVQPKPNTNTFGLNSLKYSGAVLWNKDLPSSLKEITDINIFRKLIKTWSGPKCSCGLCTMCRLKQ